MNKRLYHKRLKKSSARSMGEGMKEIGPEEERREERELTKET